MKGTRRGWTWISGLLIAICLGTVALADDDISPVTATQQVFSKTLQAKQFVVTAGQLNHYPDSIVAVAGTVNLTQDIPSNAVILAGQANIGGHVNKYVIASAGNVNFSAVANKSAVLFGGNIDSSPDSVMHQGGFIVGGDVNLTGNVGHNITIVGGKVNLEGQFAGDVNVVAGRLVVSPDTKIHGKLNYITAGMANISAHATINGGAHSIDPDALVAKQQVSQSMQSKLLHGLFQLLQLWVVLIVLAAVCRKTAYHIASSLRSRPLACLGYGALVIVLGFLAVPILVATVLGTYLAFIWGLTYVIIALLGYLYFAQSVGLLLMNCVGKCGADVSIPCYWKTILAALLGLIVVLLLGFIPVAGMWLVFVSVLFGVGALVRTLFSCCK